MKKAPPKFDEKKWQVIKKSLDPLGIDADSVVVGAPWWEPEPAQQQLLRQALEELAQEFAVPRKRPKPRQEADHLSKVLKKWEAARATLDERSLRFIGEKVRKPVTALIAKLRSRLDKRAPSGSSANARKEHTEHLTELMKLWEAAVVKATRKPRDKDIVRYLLACAPSSKESALKGFLVRHKRAN
jgi:hypothetical protein